MATKFGTFKHKLTGQVVSQPEHYGRLFPDLYEEVDPRDLRCTDCGVPEEPQNQQVEVYDAPEVVALDEPEPVRRSRRKDSAE